MAKISPVVLFALGSLIGFSVFLKGEVVKAEETSSKGIVPNYQTVVVGGGCFWCMDAVFRSFKGVEDVLSGYAGGSEPNPTYYNHGKGAESHAEVVEIKFDPAVLSLKQLLTIFFHAHDPTTPNRQGADVGPQYRSIILYANQEQENTARAVLKEIQDEQVWGNQPVVTEIKALDKFYLGEDYHQNYYAKNPNEGYCSFVIGPKIRKIRAEFKDLLKPIGH